MPLNPPPSPLEMKGKASPHPWKSRHPEVGISKWKQWIIFKKNALVVVFYKFPHLSACCCSKRRRAAKQRKIVKNKQPKSNCFAQTKSVIFWSPAFLNFFQVWNPSVCIRGAAGQGHQRDREVVVLPRERTQLQLLLPLHLGARVGYTTRDWRECVS